MNKLEFRSLPLWKREYLIKGRKIVLSRGVELILLSIGVWVLGLLVGFLYLHSKISAKITTPPPGVFAE